MEYMSYKYIPVLGTGIFALVIVSLFIYILTVKMKEKRSEREFDKQLHYSVNPEHEVTEEPSLTSRMLRVLPDQFIKAGIVKETTTVEDLQRRMLLIGALAFTITVFLTQNIIAGFLPLVFMYILASVYAMLKISKYKSLMNEQIPAFISIFKANIQANQHSQNAMVNAINNTSLPLYEELARPKSIMEAGDFRSGVISLRMSTENETLRQMASCIELASTSGSNIEDQIEIIEEIIEDKQIIERKKKLGVNENKPLFFVSAAFVPFAFVGSYFMSDMHRDYWFTTTASYLILIGIVVAMLISSWATWKVIQKVDVG